MPPGQAGGAPKARVRIAARIDKGGEAGVGDGRGVDLEGADVDLAPRQLVVEREAGLGPPQAVPGRTNAQRRPWRGRSRRRDRQHDVKALGHVDRCLVVHVFVEQREAKKIQVVVARPGRGKDRERGF